MRGGRTKYLILLVLYERRRERKGESFNFSLRSTEIGGQNSLGQERKFIYSTRATRGY